MSQYLIKNSNGCLIQTQLSLRFQLIFNVCTKKSSSETLCVSKCAPYHETTPTWLIVFRIINQNRGYASVNYLKFKTVNLISIFRVFNYSEQIFGTLKNVWHRHKEYIWSICCNIVFKIFSCNDASLIIELMTDRLL